MPPRNASLAGQNASSQNTTSQPASHFRTLIAPIATPTITTNHRNLSTKPIQRPPLPLERIHHIQTRHRLPLRVLRISDRIADDAFEERLEDTARFFVDHCEGRDALVTT